MHKANHRCVVSHLSSETAEEVGKLLGDLNNPHTLGLDARESLFQEDGVIVVEGQEDVVFYPEILDQLAGKERLSCFLAEELKERLFGWGAGGAHKVRTLLALFRDLGFSQVAAILDGNKRELMLELQQEFPKYDIHVIPADDVRSKSDRGTCGLLDADRQLKSEFQDALVELFTCLAKVLSPD